MDKIAIERLVADALREDLVWGDVTTNSLIPPNSTTVASLYAKSDSIVCGLPLFHATFRQLDPNINFKILSDEGSSVSPGMMVATIEGKTRAILSAERTALNFFNHMSGIATLAGKAVKKLEGTNCVVADTRKTLPLLRMIEKYAVKVGGGQNHRFDLSSMVLIKDNHIKAIGSVGAAVRLAAEKVSYTLKIECEVTNLEQAREAADAGADIILFDNMSPSDIRDAITCLPQDLYFEASGKITLENCQEYALAGVNIISMGSLTHSAPYSDFSLEF